MMKTNAFIAFFAALAAVLACSADTCRAQTAPVFTGRWYSPDIYLDIDFHGKSITDLNSMDGDPCPGMIRMRRGRGSGDYSISTAVVSGGEAVASAYVWDANVGINFKLLPDGSMRMDCLNFKYLSADGDETSLPSPVTLLRAEPFSGEWRLKGGDGKLTLNLYYPDVFNSEDGQYYYGLVYVAFGNGARVDLCTVTGCKVDGNRAEISFTGGRDGNKYKAVLAFDPAAKLIRLEGVARADGGEGGDCLVADGMVFAR